MDDLQNKSEMQSETMPMNMISYSMISGNNAGCCVILWSETLIQVSGWF